MAFRDFEQFLVNLSKHASLRAAFKRDPEKVMTESGLSDTEKKLVRAKDVKAIKKYLGDKYLAAISVNVDG